MKKLTSILFVLIIALNVTACNTTQSNDNEEKTAVKTDKKIKVYYFHYSHRCKTCVAVEEETKKALKELYPKEVKSGAIIFHSINMDKKEGEQLAEKMQISGQTLIFIQDNKKINLTNDGFMYAVTNPGKLKTKIKQTIVNFLN